MKKINLFKTCVLSCLIKYHSFFNLVCFILFCFQLRPDPVKAKILELIQIWSHAFRNEPSYKVVQDTFHLMKMEGLIS